LMQLSSTGSPFLIRLAALLCLLFSCASVMAAIPRLDNPDPYATNTQGCAVYSRSGHYHEYRFPAKITETTIEDPMEVRRVERSLGLRLNRAQCERFLDPD